MRSKEKKFLKVILAISLVFICILGLIIFCYQKENVYAYSQINNNSIKISEAKEVNLDDIIKKNSKITGYKEEIEVKEEELEYITKYRNSSDIYIGETKVSQEGRNGKQAITIKKIYNEKGEIIKEEQVSAVVVKSSINKIIDIGTKVKPKPKPVQKNTKKGVKSGNLDFNIALNKPSGFKLEQFQKALKDDKDKNKIFEENAKYFYYIEEQYKINGIFVAAVGIHESAWGTSRIALNKFNLFGYGAYDSNPYNGAYTFEDFAESIDLIARVFVKYYINKPGTKIYGNEVAKGSYYNGNTLTDVNKRYATDKNWANGVYTYMNYLYDKIK